MVQSKQKTEPARRIVRLERKDIRRLHMLSYTLCVTAGQYICEMPRSWELWEGPDEMPQRLRRWPKDQVVGVSLY